MKIVVCTKAVPGYIRDPKVSEQGDKVEYKAGSIILNESDDYALEAAVALKKKVGGDVTVLTLGSLSSQKALQTALAKDADRAMRVDADTMDAGKTSRLLAEATRGLEYDLILTGVEASDTMASQVGLRLAALLDIPFAYAVTELSPGEEEGTVQAVKEIGAGLKQKEVLKLPALLCIQTGATPTRFVPFRKMMMAQKKPVKTFKPSELGLGEASASRGAARIVEVFSPADTVQAEMISGTPTEIATVVFERIKEVA